MAKNPSHISLSTTSVLFAAATPSELVDVATATSPRSSGVSLANKPLLERKEI